MNSITSNLLFLIINSQYLQLQRSAYPFNSFLLRRGYEINCPTAAWVQVLGIFLLYSSGVYGLSRRSLIIAYVSMIQQPDLVAIHPVSVLVYACMCVCCPFDMWTLALFVCGRRIIIFFLRMADLIFVQVSVRGFICAFFRHFYGEIVTQSWRAKTTETSHCILS